jgi:hypothetical protein
MVYTKLFRPPGNRHLSDLASRFASISSQLQEFSMKALISAFALLSFVAASTIPYVAANAQTTQSTPTTKKVTKKHVKKTSAKKAKKSGVKKTNAKKPAKKAVNQPA